MLRKKKTHVGVPQGSVLGPLLFIIFVNDISQHVGLSTANLFADDTLIYCNDSSVKLVFEKLQQSVNDVSKWYQRNNITVNAEKSCCMLVRSKNKNVSDVVDISIDGDTIKPVTSMNYLGLEIEETLSWNKYVDKLSKKMTFKISKLARLSKSIPKDILLKIYNSTIQPNIDYAISVWGSTTESNLNKIQRLQNHAARIIMKNFDYVNTRGIELVHQLSWMNVRERLFYFQTLMIFKCIFGLAPDYLCNNVIMDIEISKVTTRKHPMNLYVPFPECNLQKNMLFNKGARQWNALPGYLKECTNIEHFKRLLKNHIKSVRPSIV